MALTPDQIGEVAVYFIEQVFVAKNVTANLGTVDIKNAVQALDNAFDTTLATAAAAVGGGTTIINGLASVLPAALNGQQKTFVAVYVLMKRANLL